MSKNRLQHNRGANAKSRKATKQLSQLGRLPEQFHIKLLRRVFEFLKSDLTHDQQSLFRKAVEKPFPEMMEDLEVWAPSQCIKGSTYVDERNFFATYQLMSLLKKLDVPEVPPDIKKARAYSGVLLSEQMCSQFNKEGYKNFLRCNEESHLAGFLEYAQEFVLNILGEYPPDLRSLSCKHGPGASLSNGHGETHMYYKYASVPYTVTELAMGHAKSLIEADPFWIGALIDRYRRENLTTEWHLGAPLCMTIPIDMEDFWQWLFVIAAGNKTASVPKNWEKDRPIAIEASMNVFCQLGLHTFMMKRLRRYGIDITSQQKNRSLAEFYSANWDNENSGATIDLSMASELNALKLCEILLPPAWYDLLLDLRSWGTTPGSEIQIEDYSKMSSMGNGFTFALETLIFGALVYGVTQKYNAALWHQKDKQIDFTKSVAIYGDDIIVPSAIARDVLFILEQAGHKPNLKKTFVEGPFRESCGADFVSGTPVRPFFLRRIPKNVKDFYHLVNSMRYIVHRVNHSRNEGGYQRTANRCNLVAGSSDPLLTWLHRFLPKEIEVGPVSDEESDTYLHLSYDEFIQSRNAGKWKTPALRFGRGKTPVVTGYSHSSWYAARRVFVPNQRRPKDWLFRRLLWQRPPMRESEPIFWFHSIALGLKSFQGGSGSSFNVPLLSGKEKVVPFQTPVWQDTYGDETATFLVSHHRDGVFAGREQFINWG